MYHTPVLLKESVDGLNIKPDGVYVDVTFGGGGHSKEILSRLSSKGRLLAFDQDTDALNNAPKDDRLILINSNFKYLRNFLSYYEIENIDGLLGDLGVSSHHFDVAERGFSFRFDGALDMRMNMSGELTAADVLNRYEEKQLLEVFKLYGELDNAYPLTKLIVKQRSNKEFSTIFDFVERMGLKENSHKQLAKIFQALRIEVNKEMDALKALLNQSLEYLSVGGRLSIISYHSLEDRLVKNFTKAGNFQGDLDKDHFGNVNSPFIQITRKVIVPDDKEIELNNRSRSAKLRIAEKK